VLDGDKDVLRGGYLGGGGGPRLRGHGMGSAMDVVLVVHGLEGQEPEGGLADVERGVDQGGGGFTAAWVGLGETVGCEMKKDALTRPGKITDIALAVVQQLSDFGLSGAGEPQERVVGASETTEII
jgi:hypothetical protein